MDCKDVAKCFREIWCWIEKHIWGEEHCDACGQKKNN